jgi:hypothetical protein
MSTDRRTEKFYQVLRRVGNGPKNGSRRAQKLDSSHGEDGDSILRCSIISWQRQRTADLSMVLRSAEVALLVKIASFLGQSNSNSSQNRNLVAPPITFVKITNFLDIIHCPNIIKNTTFRSWGLVLPIGPNTVGFT